MTTGTWTDKHFQCPNPNCGMWYTATHEQDPEPKPGSFDCTVCDTPIKGWSGIDHYFDWKQVTMLDPRPKPPKFD